MPFCSLILLLCVSVSVSVSMGVPSISIQLLETISISVGVLVCHDMCVCVDICANEFAVTFVCFSFHSFVNTAQFIFQLIKTVKYT